MLRIYIVDDQELLREGLKIIIDKQADMQVIGTAENGRIALQEIENANPDLVLMDIRMPVMDGIECTRLLKQKYPHIMVLILTTFNEERYIIEGLMLHANGFLLKSMDYVKITEGIRDAARGQFVLPTEVASKLVSRLHQLVETTVPALQMDKVKRRLADMRIPFSERDEELAQYLLMRLSNREISRRMFLGEGTVKNYISELYRKLGVNSRRDFISLLTELANS